MKLRRRRRDDDPWAQETPWAADLWDDETPQAGRNWRSAPFLIGVVVAVAALIFFLYQALPAPLANETPSIGVSPTPDAAKPTTAATQDSELTSVTPARYAYDPDALAVLMLELINRDRSAEGLPPVAWDETAAAAATAHATDMIARGYFSHWNPEGLGPDHRYTAAGGGHATMENLHAYSHTYSDGQGAPVRDWAELIASAQAGFMASAGHRANILDPAHTHVGIGMAYDPEAGQFRLAQEFTNQYANLSVPLPAQAQPGDTLHIVGAFGAAAVGNAILDLAYEPFPQPLSARDLAAARAYLSPAQSVETRSIGLAFEETLVLPAGPPGYYHVRLYVDLLSGQALVVDRVMPVR